jgi:hypothetical protein
MERTERFRAALKERVCGICFDRNDDGTCGLPEGRVCAIEAHLPAIVNAVEAEHGFDLAPYVEGIRTKVCPNCNQDASGRCVFRESFDCAVDNLIYLVVEAIEEVQQVEAAERASAR